MSSHSTLSVFSVSPLRKRIRNKAGLTPRITSYSWSGSRGGDLCDLLDKHGKPSSEQVRLCMAEFVVAVQALHRQRVIHRDIKPANVLLTATGNAVLGDLGLAKSFGTGNMFGEEEHDFVRPTEDAVNGFTTEKCGTFRWSSPSQQAGVPYNYDTDVWSLGLLLFKLKTGRLPFGGDVATTDAEIEVAYGVKNVDFEEEDGIDPVAKDLIKGMLDKSAYGRLTIRQVKGHKYFRGMDWDAVARHQAPDSSVPAQRLASAVAVSPSVALPPAVAPPVDAIKA